MQVTVTVTSGANNTLIRNVSVSYSASVNTIFAQVLHVSTLPVSGVSQASAEAPPNIDLYVLLDNSPSMALPATAAGITQMEGLTSKQIHRRLRLCVPPGQHQHELGYGRQPLHGRDDADPERASAVDDQRRQLLFNEARRADRQLCACAQQQHHASSGRAEQRRFDPAADRFDDFRVFAILNAAAISLCDLLDG